MKNLIKTCMLLLTSLSCSLLQAQVGYLDPTFGDNGIVVQKRLGITEGLALLPDGKILVCGGAGPDYYMDRFNSDGSNDLTFGVNGRVELNVENKEAHCKDIAVQPDGKIILVGSIFKNAIDFDIGIVRCKQDGSLDSSFGLNGLVRVDLMTYDYGNSVVLQPDGKILVTGTSGNSIYKWDLFVIRVNSDGSLDSAFAGTGIIQQHFQVRIEVSSIILQSDNKILMGGTYSMMGGHPEFMVERFYPDGTVDSNFGENGIAKFKFGEGQIAGWLNQLTDIALQSDGKIVCAGQAGYDLPSMAICRFNADGNVDVEFGNGGGIYYEYYGHWSELFSVLVQTDGKILATGGAFVQGGPLLLLRFDTDGSLDSSFATGGIQATYYGENAYGDEVSLLPDQKILVAGGADEGYILLARYNGDNILATHFKNVKAVQDKTGVTISWETLNESGTKSYSIERSSNATEFASIATVPAKGGSENKYSYTDQHPLQGIAYYRIKENALNGTATYSNTLKIIFESNKVSLYPNPAKNTLTITGLNKVYTATIRITDIHGREILQQKTNNNSELTLTIRALAQGSYFVLIEQNGKVDKLRFIKE